MRVALPILALCLAIRAVASPGLAFAQPAEEPDLVPPRLTQFIEAEYPASEREAGVEATVDLELTIDDEGNVTEARVVGPAGPAFDAAALDAARRFVFTPARRGDAAVPSRIRYRYVFELHEEVAPPDTTGEPEEASAAPGRLDGRVLGAEDEEPVAEAEVLIAAIEGDLSRRALTGRDGRFRFDALPAGEYRVTVFANELAEQSSVEHVRSNEVTDVTYRLVLAVDPNTFSATARVRPPPREVVRRTITREELTRIAGTRGDALRTVELLPGVGRPAFSAGQLLVRGSAPQDSQVFLDSAPVPLLYHFGGLTSFYNSRLLDSIDFYPGNFSARYGRKTGGILEVATRDPARDGFHGVLDVNIIDASLLVEAPIGDNVAVAFAGRRSYVDFWFENVLGDDLFDVVTAPVYYDYQAMLMWRPSPVDRVRASVYGSGDSLELIFAEPQSDPNIRGNFDLSTQFHRFFLGWTRALTDDVDQDLQLAVGPTLLDFTLGPDLGFHASTIQIEARGEWRMRLSDRVRVIAGIDSSVTPADIEYRGPPPGQSEGGDPGAGGSGLGSQEIETQITSLVAVRPGVYVESDLRPIDPWQVIMGLRLDWYDEIKQWSFDPRIVSIVTIEDVNRVKAGVGVFSQPPEFVESSVDLGNPNLLPLHAVHVDVGYERDLFPGVTVGLEGFYKQLWDRVVATEGGLGPRFVNGGIGRIYGLEVSGRVQPAGRRWFGFLSYTLMRSERQDYPEDPWRLFDFDQTHILAVSVVYRLGRGWEVGGTFRFVTGNPMTPITEGSFDASTGLYRPLAGEINSARNDPFTRLDLRVEKQFVIADSFRLAVYLDVQNVYNATNPEGTLYDYRFRTNAPLQGLPIIPSFGLRGEL